MVALLSFATPPRFAAAQGGQPPAEAYAIVVRVLARFRGAFADGGAGVVVGVDADSLTILTARHVVARSDTENGREVWEPAASVRVSFHKSTGSDTVVGSAILLDPITYVAKAPKRSRARGGVLAFTGGAPNDGDAEGRRNDDATFIERYDIAVVRVPRPRQGLLAKLGTEALNRRGNTVTLLPGDPLAPMGCPLQKCWDVPLTRDRLQEVSRGRTQVMRFQSSIVRPGSSGGPVFNAYWEVVGIVYFDENTTVLAYPIEQVLETLDRSGIRVGLRAPRYPREGYHAEVSASYLRGNTKPIVADSVAEGARLPSGRLTFSRRGRSRITTVGSLLRLTAYNAALSAGFVGLKYDLDVGRLSIHPFGDVGAGRLVTRFDSGGYYAVQSGKSVYAPVWRREQLDGLVFGGGATVGWLVAPHIRLSSVIGHWNFTLTPHAPKMPALYYGGGIRWER